MSSLDPCHSIESFLKPPFEMSPERVYQKAMEEALPSDSLIVSRPLALKCSSTKGQKPSFYFVEIESVLAPSFSGGFHCPHCLKNLKPALTMRIQKLFLIHSEVFKDFFTYPPRPQSLKPLEIESHEGKVMAASQETQTQANLEEKLKVALKVYSERVITLRTNMGLKLPRSSL